MFLTKVKSYRPKRDWANYSVHGPYYFQMCMDLRKYLYARIIKQVQYHKWREKLGMGRAKICSHYCLVLAGCGGRWWLSMKHLRNSHTEEIPRKHTAALVFTAGRSPQQESAVRSSLDTKQSLKQNQRLWHHTAQMNVFGSWLHQKFSCIRRLERHTIGTDKTDSLHNSGGNGL